MGRRDLPRAGAGVSETGVDLGRVEDALRSARGGPGPKQGAESSAQFLVALALLRRVREQVAGWEPELIAAARTSGASWAQLAPALGVASRQAAERRALRLRTGSLEATGEARVAAVRDRRAAERAVDASPASWRERSRRSNSMRRWA